MERENTYNVLLQETKPESNFEKRGVLRFWEKNCSKEKFELVILEKRGWELCGTKACWTLKTSFDSRGNQVSTIKSRSTRELVTSPLCFSPLFLCLLRQCLFQQDALSNQPLSQILQLIFRLFFFERWTWHCTSKKFLCTWRHFEDLTVSSQKLNAGTSSLELRTTRQKQVLNRC